MEQPPIERPRYVSGNTDPEISRYEVDAYRERTYEERKAAHADRLAEVRMDAVKLAFDVYKQEPGTFGLDDVFQLADRFVEYTRQGNQPQDGTTGRFHGK